MKSFLSFKPSSKRKYLIFVCAGLIYGMGFAARAYSPAHIGQQAIPIPTLIPVIHTIDSTSTTPVKPVVSAVKGATTIIQPGQSLSFSHNNITTTYFWVGEPADGDNGYIANSASTWDEQWQKHYGGVDSPSPRNGYDPAGFTPRENPFYFALPYSDIDGKGNRRPTAANCPLANSANPHSWC